MNKLLILPVGIDCYMNAIACALDILGRIDIMLELTTYDFLYTNITNFINLEINGKITDYLSKENPLIFEVRPESSFYKQLRKTRYQFINRIDGMKILDYDMPPKEQFHQVCENLCNSRVAPFLSVNVSTLRNEYQNIDATLPRGRNSIHTINILNVTQNKCHIIDTQFRANGSIDFSALMNAAYSVRLFSLSGIELSGETLSQHNLLMRHILKCIHNCQQSKDAMDRFIDDLGLIIYELSNAYGPYAHAVFSFILSSHRLERRGLGGLYEKISPKYNEKTWKNIICCAQESGRLWYQFDAMIDKNFLKGYTLDDLTIKLKHLLLRIKSVDINLFHYMQQMI